MVTHKKTKQKKTRDLHRPSEIAAAVGEAGPATKEKPRFDERWIMLGLLGVLAIIVFRGYLFFEKSYLFKDIGSDSVNAFYPQVVHLVDYLHAEGLPKWSFSQGMGQNIFAFGTGDIFLPVFYLFGRDHVAFALAYVEVLKILLGGFFFHAYLRTMGLTRFASLAGGLLFGFSGYMILGGGWYAFSYEALCCSLVLLGFESVFKKNVWWILPIPFSILGAFQPFDVYLYGLLLFVYATIRFIEDRDWNIVNYAGFISKVGGAAVLGVAIGSVFLFENVAQLVESPRVGGDSSYVKTLSSQPILALASPIELSSIVLRLFSSDLQGTGNSFRGWTNYLEAPILYCGLITLLTAPQFFRSLQGRKLWMHLALAGACVSALAFPYFRYMFWGFNGNYYRAFSFFVSLVLLYFGVRGLSQIDRTSNLKPITLAVSLAVCLGLLFIPPYERYTKVDQDVRGFVTIFLVAYAVILVLMKGAHKGFVKKLLLATMLVELAFLSNITVNHRDVVSAVELSSRVGYNDYSVDAVRHIQSMDSEFFRINKDYGSGPAMHESMNDSKVQQYYGSSSYYSFNQKHYIEFLQTLDIVKRGDESGTRWAVGTGSRPLLEAMTSVKYKLTKRPDQAAFGPLYEHLADFNDVHVYRNPDSLPLGFGYDSYMTASEFSKLSIEQKDKALLQSAVIQDTDLKLFSDFKPFDPATLGGPEYTLQDYKQAILARRKNALTIKNHSQNRIEGTVTLDRKNLMFFSIPYDQGWSPTVDGQRVPLLLVNTGFIGIVLDKGTHSISLEFHPRYLKAGAAVSLISLLAYGVLIYRTRSMRHIPTAAI